MTTEVVQNRLSELRSVRESRREGSYERYMQLVTNTADGTNICPEDAAATLDDFGVDCERLETDVKTLLGRRQWAAILAEMPAHEAKLGEVQDKIEKASWERRQVVGKMDYEIGLLCQERDALAQHTAGAGQAVTHLRESAWPHLKRRLQELRSEMAAANDGMVELESHVVGLESACETSRRTLELAAGHKIANNPGDLAGHKQQFEHCSKILPKHKNDCGKNGP